MNSALTTPRGLIVAALIAISLCLTLVSCGDTKSPKRLLQLKLYPKDAFILYVSGENEILINDMIGDFGGSFETTYRWDVLSVDPEGNIQFNVSVKSALYPVFMGPLGPAFENTTFTVRMAADGEILGFDGTDKMRTEVSTKLKFPLLELEKLKGLSDEDYEKAAAEAKQGMLIHIQDEALRGLFEPLFRVWPAIPVAPADKWTLRRIPTHLPIPNGNRIATTEFEVTSWEDGEVTLNVQSILQTLDADDAEKLSGSAHGTIVLDAIGGFLKRASLSTEAKGSIAITSEELIVWTPFTLRQEMFVEILKL